MPERSLNQLTESSRFPEAQLAYNFNLDVRAYKALLLQNGQIPPEEFAQRLISLNDLTRTNIETSIGERYNAELFQTPYQLINGRLKSPTYDIPFLDVIKKGQEYRQQTGSQDIEREKAEVAGFAKVEEAFASSELESDAKVIVISPKGVGDSIYGHNFYDLYQKDDQGQIIMSRYSSKNNYNEFSQAAKQIDPFSALPESPTDADFLKNPLVTYKNLEEIKNLMTPDEKTISLQELEKIIQDAMPLIQIYMQKLLENPSLVEADDYLNILKATHLSKNGQVLYINNIRQVFLPSVKTACGISGAQSGPFSVAEFGLGDHFGTLKIQCENLSCRASYTRTPGQLENACRYCGGTKGIVC